MKYFTIDWWAGYQTDDDRDSRDTIDAYRQHVRDIRHRLTPELIALQETISLHDASLVRLEIRGDVAVMRLRLGNGQAIELRYAGVTHFESMQRPERSLDIGGYGDLGYDEVDVFEDGSFEHRILFASSIELHFRFATLELRISSK